MPLPQNLAELETLLARDLLLLQEPAREWVPARAHPVHGPMLDALVVGGGMAGLAVAFRLRRFGLRRLLIVDRNRGGFEGPWATYARMETLRSPKELAGPAIGLPNLTFRAWWEAQHGAASFEAIHRIPRLDWAAYLRWYGKVCGVPVESGVALAGLAGDGEAAVATLRGPEGERQVACRHLILANGRDGLGGPYRPPLYRDLPKTLCAHSADPIDFAALRGRDVAVVGGSASAVDNAAEALEAGAATVVLLVRRPRVPRINKGLAIGSPGMNLGYRHLPDEQRWRLERYIWQEGVAPPRGSMQRAGRHANFRVLTSAEVRSAEVRSGRLALGTSRGPVAADFLILGTGFSGDWAARPELAALRDRVAIWRDRYVPAGFEDSPQAEEPVLGPALEFIARDPAMLPWAGRVHCFNYAANLSHGKVTGDIPAISLGAERVAEGICSALFAEDFEAQYRRLVEFDTPELLGDEWREAADEDGRRAAE